MYNKDALAYKFISNRYIKCIYYNYIYKQNNEIDVYIHKSIAIKIKMPKYSMELLHSLE